MVCKCGSSAFNLNPIWLLRNASRSWRHRASILDFAKSMAWTYAGKLPKREHHREWEIGFRYPEPIGSLRLLLRGNLGSDAFIHGEVFAHEYYHLPLPSPPATILDLGSNTGLTAVYFGRQYPNAQLACVEPVPDNLRVLHRNLDLNGIRATVIPAAADVEDGKVSMTLDAMDYGHRIAGANERAAGASIEVASVSVPTIMERLGWERIGLLKVDIEGHERLLFARNCDWLNRIDSMCIECHEGFGEPDLTQVAVLYGFERPRRLPGIWLLRRPPAHC